MKIEECKEVIHKCENFRGHEYILKDKDILLNSIKILAHIDYFKCSIDDLMFKDTINFNISKISENKYRVHISTIVDCNEFFISYDVLRDVKKLTLDKDDSPDITKKEDGSLEIVFQKNRGD